MVVETVCSWEEQPGITVPAHFPRGSDTGSGASGSLFYCFPTLLLVFLPQSSCEGDSPTLRGAVPRCYPQPLSLQRAANVPLLVYEPVLVVSTFTGTCALASDGGAAWAERAEGLLHAAGAGVRRGCEVGSLRDALRSCGVRCGVPAGCRVNLPCPLCPRCCCFFKRKRKKTAQRHK